MDDSDQGEAEREPQAQEKGKKKATEKGGRKRRYRFPKNFNERVWSEKERDLSELILWRFEGEGKYDYRIENKYRPPHDLDEDDSALTDPTVAARVALNAYLPADRREMKQFNNDVLMANAVRLTENAMNFVTEAQFRMYEVEQQRIGFLAFKDMYDEATSDNKELKGLLDNIDGHSVPKMIAAIKSTNEALEFEKKMSSLHVEEINSLNQQLITSNEKFSKAAAELKIKDSELLSKTTELLDKDSELERKKAELEEKVAALQKSCSELETSAKELQLEKDKAASDRQHLKRLRAENTNLLADKKKLQSELESAKAEGSSRAIPDEVINAFEKGFNSCQKLIKKKFPEAGVDYGKLSIVEVSESEAEEEDDEEESEEE